MLYHSDLLYQFILNNLTDVILLTDNAGNILFVSENIAEIFGYFPQEVQDLGNIRNLIGDKLFDQDYLAERRVIENLEREIVTKSGEKRRLSISVKQIFIQNGIVLYSCRNLQQSRQPQVNPQKKEALKLYHDLQNFTSRTEQWQEQQTTTQISIYQQLEREVAGRFMMDNEPHETQGYFQSLVNVLPQSLYRKDLQGRLTFVNRAFLSMLGMRIEEVLGKTVYELYEPELAIRYIEDDQEVLETGKISEKVEFYSFPRSNRSGYLQVVKSPIYDADREMIGIQGIFWDVTEKVAAETQLREQERFLRSIYEDVAHCIFVIDVLENGDFQYVSFNPPYEKLMNITTEEAHRKTPDDLFSPSEAQRMKERYAQCVSWKGAISYEESRFLRDRETWWVVTLTPLYNEQAEVYRIIGTSINITERKQAEVTIQSFLQREKLMVSMLERLNQSLDAKEILNATVEEVRNFLQVERVVFYEIEVGKKGEFIAESVAPECKSIINIPLRDPCFESEYAEKYRQGYIGVVNDIEQADYPLCYLRMLRKLEIRAIIIVPIVVNEKLQGLLCAHQCSAPYSWKRFEINMLQQLAIQISIAMQQSQLHSQLQETNAQLKQLAAVDGLTGLANRRHLDDYLEAEWQRLAREQDPLSLVLCDLDHFKNFNDYYGHLAGDDCLRKVAGVLQSACKRPADLAARYGGEELAVILPNTPSEGALQVAEEILESVRNLQIPHAKSEGRDYVTLSIGVATIIPTLEQSSQQLIGHSDLALYQAKEQGRDQIRCFQEL